MQTNPWLLLPIVFPMIAGILIGFVQSEQIRNISVCLVLFIELLFVILLCQNTYTFVLWQMTPQLSIAYHTDDISIFFACLMCVIWLFAGIYACGYMKHEHKPERFFLFYIMTLGALVSVCFSQNLMTLYISYEYMTILTLPLVLHTQTIDAVRASMKYFGYSIFGAGLGLLGFFFFDSYCDTTSFVPGGTLNEFFAEHSTFTIQMVYLITVIGFGCKAGMFPLHGWLPTAHPVAPSPASAVLSGIITKCGVIAIIRVTYYMVGVEFLRDTWVQYVLLSFSIITIFMGSMLAYKEKLLKKRLAYSTVSQVSYVLFGLFLMHPIAFVGALLQVIYHAIAKNTLFFGAGAMIFQTAKTLVSEYRGIGKQMKFTIGAFTIGALSLIGIPPTAGFVSKWYLAQYGVSTEMGIIGMIGVCTLMMSALLTAGYLWPIVHDGYFPGKNFTVSEPNKKDVNLYMLMPMCILAALLLILGIFPQILITYFTQISQTVC